jgi:hypothetical protein
MTALPTALTLAARGFAVFPCRPDKAPACPHGHLDASRDPATVRDLWRRWPGDLIGTPTGIVNGFDVLDIDPRHGGDMWHAAHMGRLPSTRIHQTRSGGLHILFRHAEGVRNSAGKIAPGVDVRGEGGFVIWWPAAGCSVLHGGPQAPWPTWLLAVLRPPPALPVPATLHRSDPRPAIVTPKTHVMRLIERALFRVRTASPGQRHAKLRAAACTLGGLLDAGDFTEAEAERELLAAVKAAGGHDVHERNALATITWGLRKGRQSPLLSGGENA